MAEFKPDDYNEITFAKDDHEARIEFSNLLLNCQAMSDRQRRSQVLRILPSSIGVNINEVDTAFVQILEIVQTCDRYEGGLKKLVRAVYLIETETKSWRDVELFLARFKKEVATPPDTSVPNPAPRNAPTEHIKQNTIETNEIPNQPDSSNQIKKFLISPRKRGCVLIITLGILFLLGSIIISFIPFKPNDINFVATSTPIISSASSFSPNVNTPSNSITPILLSNLLHSYSVRGISWSKDNTIATSSDNGDIKLWKADGMFITTLIQEPQRVNFVSWSPDGTLLASGSNDKSVRLWKKDLSSIGTITNLNSNVNVLAWSPDGKILASASAALQLRLWDVPNNKFIADAIGHRADIHGLSWSPDGKKLASGSSDGSLRLWDAQGNLLANYPAPSIQDGVGMVSWSSDGQKIAYASGNNVIIIDPNGKLLNSLPGNANSIRTVAWSPDGKFLASGGDNEKIIVWDENLKLLTSFPGNCGAILRLAWSPDSKSMAIACTNNLAEIWKIKN